MATKAPTPLDRQVGGSHYVSKVQHVSFCQRNQIPWCEAAAIKYIIRHRKKNGKQDLEKAIHYIELCIHEEYIDRADGYLPTGMNLTKFDIATGDFLRANGVAAGSPEYLAVYEVLQHQTKRGESTLRDAMKILQGLLKSYPKLDGSELL